MLRSSETDISDIIELVTELSWVTDWLKWQTELQVSDILSKSDKVEWPTELSDIMLKVECFVKWPTTLSDMLVCWFDWVTEWRCHTNNDLDRCLRHYTRGSMTRGTGCFRVSQTPGTSMSHWPYFSTRVPTNETNLGLFKISFLFILARCGAPKWRENWS